MGRFPLRERPFPRFRQACGGRRTVLLRMRSRSAGRVPFTPALPHLRTPARTHCRSGRVPPLRSGPGCARSRQRYNRCQLRRAPCATGHDTAVAACSGVSALRARIPHATATATATSHGNGNGNGSGPRGRCGPSPPGPLSRTHAAAPPEFSRMYGRGGAEPSILLTLPRNSHRPVPLLSRFRTPARSHCRSGPAICGAPRPPLRR